ncbi:AhpC/TSA-family protein [Nitzschia inconspicua]|uniref:AhpC/TSA-family protein n=1 Tax=Nitzschia inconspicua TaxID=303405 RepID=A0A9K3L805_9STRA|nr:AhpC/TSA-family protein [Nitzschia inconspicua]
MTDLMILAALFLSLAAAGEAFVAPGSDNHRQSFSCRTTSLKMGFLNRFRKKRDVKTFEPIREGQTLPEIDVEVVVSSTASSVGEIFTATIHEVIGGPGTNLLIGMPGAYTPTCTTQLPEYVKITDELKKLGVNNIAVVTTNDKFVNSAWAKDLGILAKDDEKAGTVASGTVTILADGDGDLVQQLGLTEDMGYGVGVRSKRFVIILEDGVVQRVEVDEGMEECDKTRPENIVKILTPEGSSKEISDVNIGAMAGFGALVLVGLTLFVSGGIEDGLASSSTVSEGFRLLQQFGN